MFIYRPQGIGDYTASALLKWVRGMFMLLHPLASRLRRSRLSAAGSRTCGILVNRKF